MNCDICGREIGDQAFKVRVEGAKMLVCGRCQRLGEPVVENTPVGSPRPRRPTSQATEVFQSAPHRRANDLPREMDELDLADDYPDRVRTHRMKAGLSQEQLATHVKEKLSVIQKIETGKITPPTRLCRALEHELKVKLLVPRKETAVPTAGPTEVTVGDIIRIKGKAKNDLKL